MSLTSSTIHRNLDAKMRIFGLEAFDILSVLIFSAVMNMFFGQTSFGPILVFILPGVVLVILVLGKKNKPDDYLIHLVRYLLTRGSYSAGEITKKETKRKEMIYELVSR